MVYCSTLQYSLFSIVVDSSIMRQGDGWRPQSGVGLQGLGFSAFFLVGWGGGVRVSLFWAERRFQREAFSFCLKRYLEV